MADGDDTLLTFPCDYAVKVMGLNGPDFSALVKQLVAAHVEGLDDSHISVKPSRQGKYSAVSVRFTATSKAQLDAIYYALTADERVLMAL